MTLPAKDNRENFRLLDLSSDVESEDLQLEIIPSRKKKITRRERNRNVQPNPPESKIASEVQCALKWAVRGTLLLWLLMLTKLCAELYDQVSTMNVEVGKVSTSSKGVDDALQVCHSAAKEFRTKAIEWNNRLAKLEQEHEDLVSQVKAAAGDLATLSKKLDGAPSLADTPQRLASLQMTVAQFGSQLNGFDGTLNSAKKQALAATTGVEELRNLIHQLDAKTNETIANVTANQRADQEIRNDVSNLNTTLVGRMDGLQTRIEEISRPRSTLPPATAQTPFNTSAATSTTSTSTTSTQPGPPAKPQVVQ